MDKGDHAKGFFNNIAASAAWESLKTWGWPPMTALLAALWQRIRHGSVDWWGIAALFILTGMFVWLGSRKAAKTVRMTALEAPPIVGTPSTAASSDQLSADEDVRRRERIQHDSDLYRARQAYDGEREERKAAQLQLQAVEAKVNIFTPLQWRALELAKDLHRFLVGCRPPELRDRTEYAEGPFGTAQYQGERAAVLAPYMNKLRISYAREYASRVKALVEDLSIEGFEDIYLRQYLNEVSSHWQVVYVATALIKLAHQMDFPDMCKEHDSWQRS